MVREKKKSRRRKSEKKEKRTPGAGHTASHGIRSKERHIER